MDLELTISTLLYIASSANALKGATAVFGWAIMVFFAVTKVMDFVRQDRQMLSIPGWAFGGMGLVILSAIIPSSQVLYTQALMKLEAAGYQETETYKIVREKLERPAITIMTPPTEVVEEVVP